LTLVDFTNIIESSSTNNIVTRELGITGALKFENCEYENYQFTVTATKENKEVLVRVFLGYRLEDKILVIVHQKI
jgi:hypothetical protein